MIEDNGEEESRWETSITKLWRQARENWNRSSGQESKGDTLRWRSIRYLSPAERKKANVRKETDAISGTRRTQAYHSRRESLMTSSSRDLEVSGKSEAVFPFHSESSQNTFSERDRSNELGNIFESSVHSVIFFQKNLLTQHRGSNWKITMLGKSEYLFVVLWHGRSCQEMCGTILWVGKKKNDSTSLQSIHSVRWWPSLQRRRIEIRGNIVKNMLSDCPEKLIFGSYWTTRYSMVSACINLHDYEIDQGLARRMGSPRRAVNRRRRTREGPQPACVQSPFLQEWHTQGGKDELTSCCGTV